MIGSSNATPFCCKCVYHPSTPVSIVGGSTTVTWAQLGISSVSDLTNYIWIFNYGRVPSAQSNANYTCWVTFNKDIAVTTYITNYEVNNSAPFICQLTWMVNSANTGIYAQRALACSNTGNWYSDNNQTSLVAIYRIPILTS